MQCVVKFYNEDLDPSDNKQLKFQIYEKLLNVRLFCVKLQMLRFVLDFTCHVILCHKLCSRGMFLIFYFVSYSLILMEYRCVQKLPILQIK